MDTVSTEKGTSKMSMNLYIKIDNKELSLYQTPTHITYICLMGTDGEIKSSLTGKAALRAVSCYCLWVESLFGGQYTSEEAAKEHKKNIQEHIKSVKSACFSAKRLKIYYV